MTVGGQVDASDVWVEEFGYGLGPPTGILVLRYPAGQGTVRFPDGRDDYVHRLFWSPDGLLAVGRGNATVFLSARQAFWARRGAALEVTACEQQTVYVVCLRQVPAHLSRLAAGTFRITERARQIVQSLCQPGVPEDHALEVKPEIFAGLVDLSPLDRETLGSGLARQVAAAVIADPADSAGLSEWATRLHTSVKTLQRDFEKEYGLPWRRWRTRTRLHASLALLDRWPVTEVAHRVGYSSPSAYVAAFAQEFGETPGVRARQR